MKELEFKASIGKILQVSIPWVIDDVDIHIKSECVNVFISYQKGSLFRCSECDRMCKVHDSTSKRIRHLDLFQYSCYLNYKVPRTKCIHHGIKTITDLPLSRPGSHYSFFLNNE
jgi:transposase